MKIGIVGAGIMGRLLAFFALQEKWEVTLFDSASTQAAAVNCSEAAAGLLSPIAELDKAERIIYDLGQESLNTHWPEIIRTLASPVFFRRSGSWVIHHPQDHQEWTLFQSRISQKLGPHFFEEAEAEPELPNIKPLYFLPGEGQVDNQALLRALGLYFKAKAVHWYENSEVQQISQQTVRCNNAEWQFDWVFDCRGIGARDALPTLRSIRGELLWLHAPEVRISRPVRFLHPRYSLYIVPRPNAIYLLGASELEVLDYSPISVRTTLELLTAAYSLHAGFAEARIIKNVTHCRPTFPDHRPQITVKGRTIAINGLYRHGYLIAPALAHEVLRGIQTNYKNLHYKKLWKMQP